LPAESQLSNLHFELSRGSESGTERLPAAPVRISVFAPPTWMDD
jgi:hypothetical protein